MNGKRVEATGVKPSRDGQLRNERRARVPELDELVGEVAPRMWDAAHERRLADIPDAWRVIVSDMQDSVSVEADKAEEAEPDTSGTQRRGYEWNFKVGRVADMLEHMMRTIRSDIGFDDGATLASMALVKSAMLRLQIELQDGGTKEGREDGEENQYRVVAALRALTPEFDDVHMLRVRALQVAEVASRTTRIPTDADVKKNIDELRDWDEFDAEFERRQRDFVRIDQPVLHGVLARSWLTEVDERFSTLDPLVVMEEFAEAHAATRGGKSDGGEARVGPVRAVARLAVTCGALGYEQRDGEGFDAAVDRARGNLLMARSRMRKELRSFPGRKPPVEDEV